MTATGKPLRIGTSGCPGSWTGVLRRIGGAVLVDCGHSHRNRDQGNSGRECIVRLIRTIRYDLDDQWIADHVQAAQRARSLGARITDDEARAKASTTLTAARATGVATEQILSWNGQPAMRFDGHRMVEEFPAITPAQ